MERSRSYTASARAPCPLRAKASIEARYASSSSGSNLGPTNPELLKEVAKRVDAYRKLNGLGRAVRVPVDAVTASASGLDPDISVANARFQAGRVARERGLAVTRIRTLIDAHTSGRTLGVLGEKTVNVLELNLALDRLSSNQN